MRYLAILIDALISRQFKYAYIILHLIIFGKVKTHLTYAGGEPKMEVCNIISKEE